MTPIPFKAIPFLTAHLRMTILQCVPDLYGRDIYEAIAQADGIGRSLHLPVLKTLTIGPMANALWHLCAGVGEMAQQIQVGSLALEVFRHRPLQMGYTPDLNVVWTGSELLRAFHTSLDQVFCDSPNHPFKMALIETVELGLHSRADSRTTLQEWHDYIIGTLDTVDAFLTSVNERLASDHLYALVTGTRD